MVKRIRKAIFPLGGLGTRFLPVTKAMPKEMLPVVDRPLIQYAVDEAHAAGIEEFIFVTGRGKSAIEDYFDHSYELEAMLAARGNVMGLQALRGCLPRPGQVAYMRQQKPLGLGHAVWCARNLVGNEPCAVVLADDLILSGRPCLRQMIEAYEELGGNLVAVMDVPKSLVSRYGILEGTSQRGALVRARALVEKPAPECTSSTLAVVGRYILDPSVFHRLDNLRPGASGEIQLTDAIARTIDETGLYGLRFSGRRFDCGDKIGFFEANLAFMLARADLAAAAQAVVDQYASSDGRQLPAPPPNVQQPRGHEAEIAIGM
jgi:UTP--glucose-1-phosphate uridylyltransferase